MIVTTIGIFYSSLAYEKKVVIGKCFIVNQSGNEHHIYQLTAIESYIHRSKKIP